MFAEENKLQKLSELGDSLERLNVINWEMFRPELKNALHKERKSNAGRPPYDCVLLFKTLVLQRIYNLSDDQTEYQINDRMSFMRFLGLSIHSKVPDAKTIWLFKDTLTQSVVIEKLFRQFEKELELKGIVTRRGTIVDATFVDAPRQRNSRDENKTIKKGKRLRNGRKPCIKWLRRIPKSAGQRKAARFISGTKITRRLTMTTR